MMYCSGFFQTLLVSQTQHEAANMKRVILICIVPSQMTPYSHNNPNKPKMDLHFCPLCETHFRSYRKKRVHYELPNPHENTETF